MNPNSSNVKESYINWNDENIWIYYFKLHSNFLYTFYLMTMLK